MSSPQLAGGCRRLLLVDLDWRESDLVPVLLRDAGLSVTLVAGASPEDPGVRIAKLCGLPHTHDLADLTRQIFDLAVVGSASPRRAQVERLLAALGTPVIAPDDLGSASPHPDRRAAVVGPGSGREDGPDLDAAFPDLADPTYAAPAREPDDGPLSVPQPDDPIGIERWLSAWRTRTGSSTVELHAGPPDALARLCRLGHQELLLDALVGLAHRLTTPQVVQRLEGADPHRTSGAWPIRTAGRSAIVAASGFDPIEGPPLWERASERLRLAWTSEAGSPQTPPGCLAADTFTARLRLAVERHRREPFAFSLHRLRFDGPRAAIDALCAVLPPRLRATDGMCRVTAGEALILFCGNAAAYGALRRRLAAAWEDAWRETGEQGPARPIVDERLAFDDPARAADFLAAAGAWIAAT